jgi:prepilin-type N-terminal cleavage/methylation domain-containing protein
MNNLVLNKPKARRPNHNRNAGFSLVELLVAVAMFTVVSASAFTLLAQHQPIFNQQQNLAEVNIALRNAVAQIELDVANAGANYYASVNIPNYPVGVVITNNVQSSGDCRTGTPLVYSTNCFDQMAIITADINTLPTTPSNSAGACVSTKSAGTATAYLAPTGSPTIGYGPGAGGLAAATAAAANYKYNSGTNPDQLLFVKNDGSLYTTSKLAAATTTATIGTNYYVKVTFGGTDTTTPGLNTASNDPYGMSTHANSLLTDSFCSSSVDYVLRIVPITYKVDLTTPSNPTLLRTVAGQTQTIAQQTLATQIIGFKIGASLFNNVSDTDTTTYSFDASSYNNGSSVPYNFTLVRSVMISLIGRTNPNPDPNYVFQNSFDNGKYEIQGVSVVVNPRNMSMTD